MFERVIEVRRHAAELVDRRDDDAPIAVLQQPVEPSDAVGVFQVAQAECGQVLEHLIFQLVAVNHEEDGRLVGLGCAEESLCRFDHGEGLAAALGVPNEAAGTVGGKGASDGGVHRAGLVLAQNVFIQLLILLGKDDVVLQEGEHLWDGAEALHLSLQPAGLGILPVEDVAPHRVPGHAVGKADGVGGDEELLGNEQLGCLAVVTADLIHAERYRLVFGGVLTFDDQYGNAIDKKDNILPCAIVAVVKSPLFGDFVHVARRVVVIDQDQVTLAVLLVVKELAPVAQVLDEFLVAVDVGVEMAELAEQRVLGLGIARIEFPHFGVKQIVEEERQRRGGRSTPSPLLGLLAGYKRPTDGLGVCEDAGLDSFVFGRGGHALALSSAIGKVSRDSYLCFRKRHIPIFRDLCVCIFCGVDRRCREKRTVRFNQNSISWNHT